VGEIFSGLDRALASQWAMMIGAVTYFALVFSATVVTARRRRERQTRLKRAVSIGLVNGQITGVDDLVNIYRGVTNASDDDISYKLGVTKILRSLLVTLASNSEAGRPETELRAKIKRLLAEIQQQTPFADVPAAERNLILDAREFIERNELNAAKQKIGDLAGLIEARNEAYTKLQSANKWSVPLAIVGLILTVVFGVASIIG